MTRAKATYYRVTDPETGKQSWVKIEGMKIRPYEDGDRILLSPSVWKEREDHWEYLYTNPQLGQTALKLGIKWMVFDEA